jgi:hypothetical protein
LSKLEATLRGLVEPSSVVVSSGEDLAGKVEAAIAREDKRCKEKQQVPLRRKPRLGPLSSKEGHVELAPLSVIHALGRAISLDRQGAARGLAEHWGCLKYLWALDAREVSGQISLSGEGRSIQQQYKRLQSEELGVGFGLAVVERLLRDLYPDHSVSVVPAELALRVGWIRTKLKYRPRFFAEVWRPGEEARVFPVFCKGHHGRRSGSYPQLASASAHVEAVHVGPWNQTPALVLSTELSAKGPVVVHALHDDGDGGVLPEREGKLDTSLRDLSRPPHITRPAEGNKPESTMTGIHVLPRHSGWFRHVLARMDAAGLMAFTGDGEGIARYLTKRQGKKYYEKPGHAAVGTLQNVGHELLGTRFEGTDHVFRIGGDRIEAFSGLSAEFFELVKSGCLREYREKVGAGLPRRPHVAWDESWGGPVSVRPDGSVLAIRGLPTKKKCSC